MRIFKIVWNFVIKNYKGIIFSIILLILLGFVGTFISNKKKIKKLEINIEELVNNNSAFEYEINELTNERGVFLETMDNLEKSRDSIITSLIATKNKLKLKDKELKNMSSMQVETKDTTIYINEIDTVFGEYRFTAIPNKLTRIEIHIDPANNIASVKPKIEDTFEIFNYEKKYYKEPKFFKRLFTFNWKKGTMQRVVVENKNDLIKINNIRVYNLKDK